MSDNPFANATFPVKPFRIEHSDQSLDDLKTLLRLSPFSKDLYENDPAQRRRLGIDREWMKEHRQAWLDYDWRADEADLNKLPHFMASIPCPEYGYTQEMHFIAVMNKDPKAIPVILLHGWPGCFLEFVDVIPALAKSTSPPVHIIVPSHPGYTYSSPPPADRDFGLVDIAVVEDKLMRGLGFDKYVAQGGDLGAWVARYLGVNHDACKGVHLNFGGMAEAPSRTPKDMQLTSDEKKALERAEQIKQDGFGYFKMHATRPSTIGYTVGASPVALMAWIGEKLLEWTDPKSRLTQQQVLRWLTVYWLTNTYPSSVYPYRSMARIPKDYSELYLDLPLGCSDYPLEILPCPEAWMAGSGRLVWYEKKEVGGHFAAAEQPEELAKDVLAYLRVAEKEL